MALLLSSQRVTTRSTLRCLSSIRGVSNRTAHNQRFGAIVTGGASGIGEATARKLASRGINVVIADLNDAHGRDLASEISSTYSVDAQFVTTDVTKEEDVKGMVDFAVQRWGRLDYAANCAGICVETARDEEVSVSTDIFDKYVHKIICRSRSLRRGLTASYRTYKINQRGLWLCQKYEALQMQKQGPLPVEYTPPSTFPLAPQRGAIVNVSSMSGLTAMGLAAYTPTKFAVLGITMNSARFYGPHGIRVNAICPGLTMTQMLEVTYGKDGKEGSAESQNSSALSLIPLRRLAFAQEQANAISFLLSPEASYINGAHLVVDGGYTPVR
ncbi:3-oxoacyl-reductase [Penicillium daleae]|uniref:3-oxoacyl-reductase n=1 Tax=Penicillium daleae TaxID=63821 RepID=A0AAD6CHQ2_9EURO|nr:3-oxoacyl-reductase [Penicillium daleae]KAJ5465323.1 3-oxoacyl-reductase [Penicillium daleae]